MNGYFLIWLSRGTTGIYACLKREELMQNFFIKKKKQKIRLETLPFSLLDPHLRAPKLHLKPLIS